MENEKSERERALEEIPFRKADKTKWPEGVRGIGLDEVDGIGVDAEGDLYLQGKRAQTRARLDLNCVKHCTPSSSRSLQ